MTAYGPKAYFSDGLNVFDFVIVVRSRSELWERAAHERGSRFPMRTGVVDIGFSCSADVGGDTRWRHRPLRLHNGHFPAPGGVLVSEILFA